MITSALFRITSRAILCTALAAPCALAQSANGPATISPVSLNPLRSFDKTRFKGFVEQPLFDPARRLPPPEAPPEAIVAPPPPPPPEAPPPNLHLLGIIQGARDVAVVHRDEDPKTILLNSGDLVDDWTATVVPSGELVLRKGDRVSNYKLFKPNAPTDGVSPGLPDPNSNLDAAVAPTVDARNARLSRRLN